MPDKEEATLQIERTAGVWRFIGVGPAERLIRDSQYHHLLEPSTQIADT